MATFNQFLPISLTCKFFVLLTLTLLPVNAYVVNAQDNANDPNSNSGNTNVSTNRNSSANANTNINANRNLNTNVNRNSNANSNGDGNSNQAESEAAANASAERARRDKLVNSYWFYTLVSLMFAIVLVPFALTIMRAIKFSRATYSSPLGLPDGSLRAMLAYTLVAYLGFYILASILSISDFKPPEFLLGIVATVIGFYFGSRSGEDRGAGAAPSRPGTVQGNVTDKNGAPAAGASVELSQPGVKKLTETSDANGKYKFGNVPVGDYDIQASLAGHAPSAPAKVKVTAGAAQTVNLKLN